MGRLALGAAGQPVDGFCLAGLAIGAGSLTTEGESEGPNGETGCLALGSRARWFG